MFIQTQVLGPDTGPRKGRDPIDSVLQIKSSCLSEQDSGLFIPLISIGINCPSTKKGFPGGSVVKNPPAMQETWVQSLGWEDPLAKRTATHSSILAWRTPWTEKPGRVAVGHD